jgi:hypothetical protein
MKQSFTSQDLQALFTFPFRDPEWQRKALIGSLVIILALVIPIVPWIFLIGYMAQLMKGIIQFNRKPFMPKWDDWGKLFNDGWKLFVATCIYLLPYFIIFILGLGLTMGPLFGLPLLEARVETGQPGYLPLLYLGPILGSGLFLIAMPYAFLISALLPAILGHVAATGDFGAAFRVQEWWRIFRANAAGFILTYLVVLAVNYLAWFAIQLPAVTIVLCCLVPFLMGPILFYTSLISYSLYAQAYRAGLMAAGEANVSPIKNQQSII